MEFVPSLLKRCWFLAGPTASGKSSVAMVLAQRLNAEIVSLDSMAIYRGMDIGTAKPTVDERQQVPHHLIDVAEPCQDFSVTDFVRLAATAAQDVVDRNRVPLFVGGTGLYLRSILRGMYEGPDADWDFRNDMERKAIENGPQWLHDQLAACDPMTAVRLHLGDMRRIIRALEVFKLTGKPLSADHHHGPRPEKERPRVVVWLSPPRDWLRSRINLRIDQMMDAGWLEETRSLLNQDPPPGRTARQAIGYRELIDHLAGHMTLPKTVELIKISTRQFAKRQHTWFRNIEECQPVPIMPSDSPDCIADEILSIAHGKRR